MPIMVFGATCEEQIIVKSIELSEKEEKVEETEEPSINHNTLNINAEMHKVGDYIKYQVVLKNVSDKNYNFEEKSIELESENINLDVEFEGSKTIGPTEEKTFDITLRYSNELASSLYRGGKYTLEEAFNINYEKDPSIIDILTNPLTGHNSFFIYLIIIVSIIALLFNKKKNITMILLFGILFIPYYALASDDLCNNSIIINPNILINILEPHPCTIDNVEFLIAGQEYTNGQYRYRYRKSDDYSRRRNRKTGPKSTDECYNCGGMGHWANECHMPRNSK